ncbi:MAG: hypothetical protein EZS28_054585 [Streblomastix strix]|uniref:Uncharacterized protein n=1 Tax=Streblomastix strix TaxID=222440 RepID=A0A5J4QH29_9EUKA|nr:MAG: hypothetical protein EZS28_054585 [Streblomastix strix]
MANNAAAQRAISQLNNTLLDDRLVRVEHSQHKHGPGFDLQYGAADKVQNSDSISTKSSRYIQFSIVSDDSVQLQHTFSDYEVIREISRGLNWQLLYVSLKENSKRYDIRRVAFVTEDQKKHAQDQVATLKMSASEYTRGFVEAFVDRIDMCIVLEHFGGRRFVEMKSQKEEQDEDEWMKV